MRSLAMRLNRVVACSALFFALLLGGPPPLQHAFAQAQGNSDKREPLIAERQRKLAPNFILTDAKGDTINLSAYKGKVVLLDFWATWCGGCKTEIPWYMEFDSKYKDRGLAVIGVSMDEDGWKSVRPFMALETGPGNWRTHSDEISSRHRKRQLGKAVSPHEHAHDIVD